MEQWLADLDGVESSGPQKNFCHFQYFLLLCFVLLTPVDSSAFHNQTSAALVGLISILANISQLNLLLCLYGKFVSIFL